LLSVVTRTASRRHRLDVARTLLDRDRAAVMGTTTRAASASFTWGADSFAAPPWSIDSSAMAYRESIDCVLWPTIFMGVERGTPARSRLRTAVRLIVGNTVGQSS